MNANNRKKRRFLIAAAVLFLAAAFLPAQRKGLLFPPGWVEWKKNEILCTEPQEPDSVTLRARRVAIRKDGESVWQSDKKTPVQSVLWADIDRDGENELLLLCWKRGRYGQNRPFWVKRDEITWSQHIYIYDWTGEEIKPIWMASDISLEAVSWQFDEENRLRIIDRTGRTSAWDWRTWGLSLI